MYLSRAESMALGLTLAPDSQGVVEKDPNIARFLSQHPDAIEFSDPSKQYRFFSTPAITGQREKVDYAFALNSAGLSTRWTSGPKATQIIAEIMDQFSDEYQPVKTPGEKALQLPMGMILLIGLGALLLLRR